MAKLEIEYGLLSKYLTDLSQATTEHKKRLITQELLSKLSVCEKGTGRKMCRKKKMPEKARCWICQAHVFLWGEQI